MDQKDCKLMWFEMIPIAHQSEMCSYYIHEWKAEESHSSYCQGWRLGAEAASFPHEETTRASGTAPLSQWIESILKSVHPDLGPPVRWVICYLILSLFQLHFSLTHRLQFPHCYPLLLEFGLHFPTPVYSHLLVLPSLVLCNFNLKNFLNFVHVSAKLLSFFLSEVFELFEEEWSPIQVKMYS